MPAITSVGLDDLSYNGITFTLYHSKVRAVPVLDSSGRTTKAVNFSIEVGKALVEPAAGSLTTDSALLTIRQKLTQIGKALTFENKGYGQLNVNVPGNPVRDANFGPKPHLVDWWPAGNDQNCFVNWTCETMIPQCPDAKYQFGISELNYTVEHKIDTDGYPSVMTSGHLEIPMTRRDEGATLPDHVDRYREKIETAVPIGFQRRDPSFKFNEAKTRLDFSWTDLGIRTALPVGCTRCDLRHRVTSTGPAFVEWIDTISGPITVPPNVPKDYALRVFLSVVADRLAYMRRLLASPAAQPVQPAQPPQAFLPGIGNVNVFGPLRFDGNNGANGFISGIVASVLTAKPGTRLAVIPMRFSMDNAIGGRETSFEYTYRVVLRRNIEQDVSAQGMWLPFPATSFKAWQQSMRQLNVTSVRGPHQLRWSPEDDAIIDLCTAGQLPKFNPHQNESSGGSKQSALESQKVVRSRDPIVEVMGGITGEDMDPARVITSLTATLPDPELSWIAYKNILLYHETRGRYARHRPQDGNVNDPIPSIDAAGTTDALGRASVGTVATATKTVPDILQEVDAPPAFVILRGYADRLGNDTPLPNLLTCKGLIAKRNRVITTWQDVIGRMGDIPLIRRYWEIEFLLNTPPQGRLPILSDPLLGVRGGTMT